MAAKIITEKDVTVTSDFNFCTEASDLGLKPGEWPETLETTMGNKLMFRREAQLIHNGEFGGYIYKQLLGCISLTVFND